MDTPGASLSLSQQGREMHPSEVPMRRIQLDKIVNESGGSQLPDDDQMDQHLNDLLDELAALIDQIKFIKKTDGLVAQAHFLPGSIEITYDSDFTTGNPSTDDIAMRTACLLHELMHVSVDQCYIKPPGEEAQYLRSFNFHYGTDAAHKFATQCDTITKNLEWIRVEAESDSGVKAAHEHINGRLDYGVATPSVHYDTVLLDLLVYLRLKRLHDSQTYKYLSTLSQEAQHRRRTGDRSPVRDISNIIRNSI
jgi:hypothetical protein